MEKQDGDTDMDGKKKEQIKLTCFGRLKKFLIKYFWEGQRLDKEHELLLENIPEHYTKEQIFILKHRKLIGYLIPTSVAWFLWWTLAIKYNFFAWFPDRYVMSLTMIFGGLVAGGTSEGGGAVAFPVMTLLLKIPPPIARDFALMIQTSGMSCATFAIFWMKIAIEWHSIVFCSSGGIFGFLLGVYVIDDLLTPAQKKMGFVSIFFSFAIALFILNTERKRKTFDVIQHFNLWKACVLIAAGFVGGICTGVLGSGVDICSFSMLTLLFHITEKVATPTSVVLMALTSAFGVYWRQFMMDGIYQESWEYLACCAEIVFICAPLGSVLTSHFHRLVLASLIYIMEIVALITGIVIVRPDLPLALACGCLIFSCFVFFFTMSRVGKWMAQEEFEHICEELELGGVHVEECVADAESHDFNITVMSKHQEDV